MLHACAHYRYIRICAQNTHIQRSLHKHADYFEHAELLVCSHASSHVNTPSLNIRIIQQRSSSFLYRIPLQNKLQQNSGCTCKMQVLIGPLIRCI